MRLDLPRRSFDFAREVAVMAIVNRTPDSFYDRGRTFGLDAAVDHALAQVAEGADIVDVGGVKAGPGRAVEQDEERERILPFVEAFRARSDAVLSVDTFRATVAAEVLAAGADIVNDVSGMAEAAIADAVAAHDHAALVVMHAGGRVRTRPFRSAYHPDVTHDVLDTCGRLAHAAEERGVPRERIILDPGHDFGKNTFQSLEITRNLDQLAALGYPVLVALSRKDFLGETLGPGVPPAERLEASLACAVYCVLHGARIVRVHDTAATKKALRTIEVLLGWRQPASPARGLV